MTTPAQNESIRRLEELASAKCNGSATEDDLRELNGLLAGSAACRDLYWEHIANHACLAWMQREGVQAERQRTAPIVEAGLGASDGSKTAATKGLAGRFAWLVLTLAASLLVVAWSARGFDWFDRERGRIGNNAAALAGAQPREGLDSTEAMQLVGSLSPLSGDAHWSFGVPGERNRETLVTGETLWLNQGAAQLRLVSGATAQLEAPLILEMRTDQLARLFRGRVTVDVPESEDGFVVETVAAEVIDLGTTFSVDVADNGDTDVIVFAGEVDVNPSRNPVGPREADPKTATRLHTGEALRVAEDGTLSRIVNVRRTHFSDAPQRTDVIQEVRDNIVREQTMKYYEIVAQDFQEDSLAFVDRDYQWNGLDRDGIPSYLLGGDYVKTFNDDKIAQDLRITVTLKRPSTLYLLVDDRHENLEWLQEQFEDTGDDVGLDEGPHDIPDDLRELAVGAGVSIDQVHSVWRCREVAARQITIGRSGPLIAPEAKLMGKRARLNMFGIVAVALEPNRL